MERNGSDCQPASYSSTPPNQTSVPLSLLPHLPPPIRCWIRFVSPPTLVDHFVLFGHHFHLFVAAALLPFVHSVAFFADREHDPHSCPCLNSATSFIRHFSFIIKDAIHLKRG